MLAKLILKNDGINIRSYLLEKAATTIGRNSDNDIHIDDYAISGIHTVIVSEKNPYLDDTQDFYAQDMESTNGTFVNDGRVNRYLLKHGDVVKVGSHEFTFDSGQNPTLERTAIYLPDDGE